MHCQSGTHGQVPLGMLPVCQRIRGATKGTVRYDLTVGEVYRDENQAAFAAVSKLRAENAELRSQLADMRRRVETIEKQVGLAPAHAPATRSPLVLVVGSGLLLAGAVGFLVARTPSAAAVQPGRSFDRAAAVAALDSVDVSECVRAGGPTGVARVAVTFDPNGTVASAIVNEPLLIGTTAGTCLSRKFHGARIPAFAGLPTKVERSFVLVSEAGAQAY
jgi:hypothetical protein